MSVGRTPWLMNGTLFAVQSLYFSGEIAQLERRHAAVLADAEAPRDA